MLYRLTVQGEVDHRAVAALDPVSIEPVNGTTQIEFDGPDGTDMEAFAERLNHTGLSTADIVAIERRETYAAKSRKRAIIELLVVGGVLIFIFAILLPTVHRLRPGHRGDANPHLGPDPAPFRAGDGTDLV